MKRYNLKDDLDKFFDSYDNEYYSRPILELYSGIKYLYFKILNLNSE